jgi:hypothetical protein
MDPTGVTDCDRSAHRLSTAHFRTAPGIAEVAHTVNTTTGTTPSSSSFIEIRS